jgi:hypothetical protein
MSNREEKVLKILTSEKLSRRASSKMMLRRRMSRLTKKLRMKKKLNKSKTQTHQIKNQGPKRNKTSKKVVLIPQTIK